MASTQLTNRHFQQMMESATGLQHLDISNCPALEQIAIFKAKENIGELVNIAISGNTQFTILAIACLCSCPELVTIEAHGLEFSAEELFFYLRHSTQLEAASYVLKWRKDAMLWTS